MSEEGDLCELVDLLLTEATVALGCEGEGPQAQCSRLGISSPHTVGDQLNTDPGTTDTRTTRPTLNCNSCNKRPKNAGFDSLNQIRTVM